MERKGQVQDTFGNQSSAELAEIMNSQPLWQSEPLTVKYILHAGHHSECSTCTLLTLTID